MYLYLAAAIVAFVIATLEIDAALRGEPNAQMMFYLAVITLVVCCGLLGTSPAAR